MPPLIAPLFTLCAAFAVLGDAPVGWFVALAAGALAPDVDLLLLLLSPASAVRLHRGPTHTVYGLLVSSVAAGMVTHFTGGPPLALCVGLSAVGTAAHVVFDVLSIQGLALWGRRRSRRIAFPVMVALDPIVTAVCALGVLGAIGFPSAARMVGGGVAVLSLYLVALRIVLARRARVAAREALATPVEGVYPRPESFTRWTVVTRTVDGLRAGVLDLGTRRLSMLEASADADTSPALASVLGQAVMERAGYPVVREDGPVVRLRDLRFSYDWPAPPFGADIELDSAGRPRRERAWL